MRDFVVQRAHRGYGNPKWKGFLILTLRPHFTLPRFKFVAHRHQHAVKRIVVVRRSKHAGQFADDFFG